MRTALTIAGSDSGCGAGIQADLKTFAAHAVFGTSAITAVTAQNTRGVVAVHVLPVAMVRSQIDAVVTDLRPDAVKIGMLATEATIAEVARAIDAHSLANVVLDPVMVAKGGDRLLDRDAEQAYVERLFPLATIVTPNLEEAEALLRHPVRTLEDMRAAAQEMHARGVRAVVIKGGHLPGDAVDVFFDGTRMEELRAARIDTANTHGTGCTLSAAIAARLATGDPLLDAVRGAKDYLTEAIRGSYAVGRGHGPVGHFHSWRRG